MGRFINADGYTSTGYGCIGYNMFTYCNNNSSNCSDTKGERMEALDLSGLAGCGGASSLNLFFPFVYFYEAVVDALRFDDTEEKEQVRSIAIAETIDQRHQEIFPENPLTFSPQGLYMHVCVDIGTGRNGGIIKWEDPVTGIAIFEWDEDYQYGPHYHVMMEEWLGKHNDPHHYVAGEFVPEPWNTLYFGG